MKELYRMLRLQGARKHTTATLLVADPSGGDKSVTRLALSTRGTSAPSVLQRGWGRGLQTSQQQSQG